MRASFGSNLPQIVTHICQKAIFKHALANGCRCISCFGKTDRVQAAVEIQLFLRKRPSVHNCIGYERRISRKKGIGRRGQSYPVHGLYGHKDYDRMSLVILRLGESPTEEKTLGMLQTLFLGSIGHCWRRKVFSRPQQRQKSRQIK